MKIHLGFEDHPYGEGSSYKAVGATRPRRLGRGGKSTREVAAILEEHYGILKFFFEEHGEKIVEDLIEGHLQQLARPESGKGSRTDYIGKATDRAEEMFRDMLDNREMDGKVPGVPTGVAQAGYSLRKRKGRGISRRSRASFVNTGLYRDSFRVGIEDDEQ